MAKKKNINLVSVAIWMLLIVVISYFCLSVLHDQFGLLGGTTEKVTKYNVEFITQKDNDIKFEVGKRLYLYDSREYFCDIVEINYQNEDIIVKATVNGFYQNDTFFLNGKHYIAKNSKLLIMNNKTEIKILNIF